MHPDVAALVLAASPSPSPSPSGHGGIQWGDVPAWVAAVATVVGLTAAITGAVIAYRQFRQQTDVLRGEVERNKRRDELLDGQLQELKERADDHAREQAEKIFVSLDPDAAYTGTVHEGALGRIINRSLRPITQLKAVIAESTPGGSGTTTHGLREWVTGEIGLPVISVDKPSRKALAALKPDFVAECRFGPLHLGDDARLLVRFVDDVGHRWQVDSDMHLEPAPDDGW